jgi:hypothetical protein
VANGTTLYWSTTGTVDAADFTDGQLTGSVVINSNTGSVVRTLEEDVSTGEGEETFQLQLRTGSVGGTIVDTSNLITVNDTSTVGWVGPTLISAAYAGYGANSPVVELSFDVDSDGSWTWFNNISSWPSGPTSTSLSGSWALPNTPGIGASYEIQFVSETQTVGDPGDALAFSPAPGATWYDLTAGQNFNDIIPLNTSAAEMELTFTIREKAVPANTITRTFTIAYELTP